MKESTILLDHHLAQTTMFPFALEIVHADGIYITDRNNKKYIDLISGVGVNNIGHGNRKINDAIKAQVDRFLHVMVYGEYVQESQVKAARLLTSLLPSELDCCYFVNSGTEANEAALKLAKRITGRTKMIACIGSYHGNTHGSLSVSSNENKKSAFRPLLPDVHFMRFNVMDDLQMIDEHTACVMMETIQGDAGIRIPSLEYIKALHEKCTSVGAQLILDEIQCGMGRTGTMFAFEQYQITPDILTLGKALGGGMPAGCLVSSRKNMELFTHHPMLGHISTFAGHPVICAAVASCLEFYIENKIVADVHLKGKYFAEKLSSHNRVKAIRYRGLFFAIDLHSENEVQQVVEKCLADGLISFWFLSCPSSFRIAPPLTITQGEMEMACNIILSALDDLE